MLHLIHIAAVFAVVCVTVVNADWMHSKNHKQTNMLFIMYDDLRPELSIYGRKHVISPNFERLASRSIVFDNNFVQVAVCNPSRDSILTGLRPDTTGTYGFQHSFAPHNTIAHQLVKSGYSTAAYGKLAHWDGDDKSRWSNESWQGGWYEYQNLEWSFMNASVQPDAVRGEDEFRDHIMTTKAVNGLQRLAASYKETGEHFMVAVGFKLPHVTLHIPQKYYDMYADLDMAKLYNISAQELHFPVESSPPVGFTCCTEKNFRYMNANGTKRADRFFGTGNVNVPFPVDAHNELMRGYCAGVTFLDTQLGRLLDEMDRLQLWDTTTVVLSSDHGMHNGEKGIWGKWTLFDESAHTPLIVHHPLSPFKGQHYSPVVEAIDIFPTIVDLLQAPFDVHKHCPQHDKVVQACTPPQGKSLAPVVLGRFWDGSLKKKNSASLIEKNLWPSPLMGLYSGGPAESGHRRLGAAGASPVVTGYGSTRYLRHGVTAHPHAESTDVNEITFAHDFALTQLWRCLPQDQLIKIDMSPTGNGLVVADGAKPVLHMWQDCAMQNWNFNVDAVGKDGVLKPSMNGLMLMGYSMRTVDYRYTAWVDFNSSSLEPMRHNASYVPLFEELYDHRSNSRSEPMRDFGVGEWTNLATAVTRFPVTDGGDADVESDEVRGLRATIAGLRRRLLTFLERKVIYVGRHH